MSEAGSLPGVPSGPRLISGFVLAAATAVALSMLACRIQLSVDIWRQRVAGTADPAAAARAELACVLAVSVVAGLPATVAALLAGVATGATPAGGAGAGWAVVGWITVGAAATGAGNVMFRYANLATPEPGSEHAAVPPHAAGSSLAVAVHRRRRG